jgi:hypothetical protein
MQPNSKITNDDEPYLAGVEFDTEEEAASDWKTLPPRYRTEERLEARLKLVKAAHDQI